MNLIISSSILIKNAIGIGGILLLFATIIVPLVKIIVFMIALMCKLNGFKDGLITTPSKISHIYGFNFDQESINKIKYDKLIC